MNRRQFLKSLLVAVGAALVPTAMIPPDVAVAALASGDSVSWDDLVRAFEELRRYPPSARVAYILHPDDWAYLVKAGVVHATLPPLDIRPDDVFLPMARMLVSPWAGEEFLG